jgi:cell division protein FtsN
MAPKDYKAKPQRAVQRPVRQRPAWLYFMAGVIVGSAVTVVLYLNEFVPVPLYVAPTETAPQAVVATKERKKAQTAGDAPKPRFEFYTMLPEMEVAVPDTDLEPELDDSKAAPVVAPGTYFLQAGSFRLLEEADRMKANLAFLGLEPSIQTVTINGSDTWHRVRVGPFSDLASLNEVRARLRENRMETMVLKIRN